MADYPEQPERLITPDTAILKECDTPDCRFCDADNKKCQLKEVIVCGGFCESWQEKEERSILE